ncbi:hypothetical protein PHLGIDRAFT_338773 [Phlebiopsis gigantea 11061_1 CR5-6]|uniref:Uncharacterized protein n=1 Tax=Phlebiopsis gigantea (strain 11061_1 CR5-6) TaxID=745531 RepID=A0A0C3S237_PHLG1|nr:hypothetical protein PHLGIDRAFT_338773 [Phlebiopsis gigantea 11061_1 CR5-6]
MLVPLSQVLYKAPNQPHASTDAAYIPFFLQDSPQPGIRLSEARNPQVLQRLQQRHEPVPIDCRAKASIRIQPTGYRAFSKQKHFRRVVGGQHTTINHEKVVQLVADVVQDFIRDAQLMVAVPPGAVRFGSGYIELDRIVLLGLRRASPASFQPELAILL